MIKILLCSPIEGSTGGILNWTKGIMNYYKKVHKGYDVIDLEVFNLSRKNSVYANDNVVKRLFLGVIDYIPLLKNFNNKLISKNFDLIHFVSSGSFGLIRDYLLLKLARKSKIKTVIHFHFGRVPQILENNNWEKKIFLKVINKVDFIIVMDQKSLISLRKIGFNNVVNLPNPLNEMAVELVREKQSLIKRKNNKIIFVGHVVPSKGIIELIEACNDLDYIELNIIGHLSQEMKEKLEKLITNKSILLRGELDYSNIISEMLSSEILILPSYSEGFPNVILEGMACGCAILATNVGAIPDMLAIGSDLPCGICVETKNVEQLRKALVSCIRDREQMTRYKINAMERVKKEYSMEKVWEQLKNIWLQ